MRLMNTENLDPHIDVAITSVIDDFFFLTFASFSISGLSQVPEQEYSPPFRAPHSFISLDGIGGQVEAGGIIYGVSVRSYPFPTPLLVEVCSSTQACNPGSSLWRMDIETSAADWSYESSFARQIVHYPMLERDTLQYEFYEYPSLFWEGDRFVQMFCLDAYGQNFDEGCTTMDESGLYGIPLYDI